MRKCLRCNVEMVEDLDVKVEGGAYRIKITQQGIFKDNCKITINRRDIW